MVESFFHTDPKMANVMISSKLFIQMIGLIMFAAVRVSVVTGQQVDVSLKVGGVIIPNNSLVEYDDVLYTAPGTNQAPTNANGFHDQTLVCETDLEDCCDAPRAVRGTWYHPDGVEVTNTGRPEFRSNRGPNEDINGRQFYGSVRIYKFYTPPNRGRFRCELPSAANPFVNQVLYANIVNFGANFRVPPVTISPSGSTGTAGETYSLMCSTTLHPDSTPLPSYVPSPTFEWFFGPNNSSLPSDLTLPSTTFENGNTYTSNLLFFRLSESHAGMYTCRIGVGRLASNAMVTVNRPNVTVTIYPNLNESILMVGQTGSTLACDVIGANMLTPRTIAYQWTRNVGATPKPVGTDSNTFGLSSVGLSDAGEYSCSITISSTLLNSDIMMSASNPQRVIIQISDPQTVFLTSTPIVNGDSVTLICTVIMSQEISESDLSLLMVDAQLSRDGTPLALTGPTVTGTIFTYTTQLNSFGRSDSGNYTCNATVRPQPTAIYLTGTGMMLDTARITTGVYFTIQSRQITNYANSSNIHITDIGEGDCGALLCFTDLTECCRDSDTSVGVGALGQWLYPNGSAVGVMSDGQDFYIDRGPNVVRLNRKSNATSTTGLFCCEVPDATFKNIRICMNIDVTDLLVSQSEVSATSCTSEVAIGVVATILIECLLAAPIIAVVLALYWKRRKQSDKNTNIVLDGGRVSEDVYDDPDKLGAITTTAPGNYELIECPAYVPTTMNQLQPAQSSDYEL